VGEEPTIGSHEADVGDKDIEFWDERGDDCVIGENFWRATGTVAPRKSSTLLLDKPAVRWFHGCAEPSFCFSNLNQTLTKLVVGSQSWVLQFMADNQIHPKHHLPPSPYIFVF
jgi:hypothetical protein